MPDICISILFRYIDELNLDSLHVADLEQLEIELESALVQTRATKITTNVWTSTLYLSKSLCIVSLDATGNLHKCGVSLIILMSCCMPNSLVPNLPSPKSREIPTVKG